MRGIPGAGRLPQLGLAIALIALVGCREDEGETLRAKRVDSELELIGGPLAHGEIGDYLIENDKVRFIISGAHHSWGPGLFGGTVVDADLQRSEALFRGANAGNDHFAELFPTASLLVADPTETQIRVVSDGSDGKIAQIEVEGQGLFYLDALTLLDPEKSSFASFLNGLDVKTAFSFKTTYTLRPGESYLEITTEVQRPAPISDACDEPTDCPEDCPRQADPITNCLVCACDEGRDMELFTDPVPLFGRILGENLVATGGLERLEPGVVGGDFLFFGGGTDVFAPGLGFDSKGAIFDNLFRGVDTITSPLAFDWIAAAGKDISYAVFTKRETRPETCPKRVVVATLDDPARRTDLVDILKANLTIPTTTVDIGVTALADQQLPFAFAGGLSEADAEAEKARIAALVGDIATIAIDDDGDCRSPRLLVPLFTSSATMVASAGSNCLEADTDDATCDVHRRFRWTRYLAVGEGDVASASKVVFEAQGITRGRIEGVVYDRTNGRPEPRAQVFALRDPDPTQTFTTYDEVINANLAATGRVGVENHAQADVGTSPIRTGRFEMTLPAGTWIIVARSTSGVVSAPQRIVVGDGTDDIIHVVLDAPGRLTYRVTDSTGANIPSKLTLQALGENGRVLHADGKRRVEMGDGRMDDGVFQIVYSPTGEGTEVIEPGRYLVTVSRGFEYSISQHEITIKPGGDETLTAALVREVDTTGWISGDFHLHAGPSMDSGMDLKLRVTTNVVEGVELLSSSDHDSVTDYKPYLLELGLDRHATTQVGLEVSTLELGHTLGFPLKYDVNDRPVHGAIDWVCKNHYEIWNELRDLGEFGPDKTVTVVAHPRDGFLGYFDQFKLDPYTLERGEGGLEANNILFRTLDCDFDAMEIFNAKRFELIRTPTNTELNDSTRCLEEINTAVTNAEVRGACQWLRNPPGCTGDETLWRGNPCSWYSDLDRDMNTCTDDDLGRICRDKVRNAVTKFSVRRMLRRTELEQTAWVDASEERQDELNTKCSPAFLDSYRSCIRKEGEANPDATAAELEAACEDSTSKPFAWTDDPATNDQASPCVQHHGVAEDWFRLLNHGMNIVAMGNSDSHGTTLEPGIPRNWIMSATDDASRIDREGIAAAIKAGQVLPSTGPFVRASISGQTYGGTVDASDGGNVMLALQVQTPSWFGVSRIEVYRNGRLEYSRDIDPAASEIVDFDETIDLGRPAVDSWYVVAVMGLRDEDIMAPVYVTNQLGELGLDKITSLAFSNLGLLSSFLDSEQQLPDYFPSLPYAMTNPIFVDVEGDGYAAPLPAPAFCPVSCTPEGVDEDGVPLPADCTIEGEVCWPNSEVGRPGSGGTCGRPILGSCGVELTTTTGALRVNGTVPDGPFTPRRGIDVAPRAKETVQHTIGRHIWNTFVHGWHAHHE